MAWDDPALFEQVIPAGFYHAEERHTSAVALRYLDDGRLEALLEGGDRLVADWRPGSTTFRLALSAIKFVDFAYDPEGDVLVKKAKVGSKKSKAAGTPHARVGMWPRLLPMELHRGTGDIEGCARDVRERGFAVLSGVFHESRALLSDIHAAFSHSERDAVVCKGWYSGHEHYAQPVPHLEGLVALLAPYLDYLLGQGDWEHDSSLQVGFATHRKVSPCLPNYHVDQMFLNKGEPFSVLIGIPLAGELDQPLGGQLAVFERSHILVRTCLETRTAEELNSDIDKGSKIRTFCNLRDWQPTVIGAMPGDAYFCHYRTIHGVSPNYLSNRGVAYVRIRHKTRPAGARRWTDSILENDPFMLFKCPELVVADVGDLSR